MTGDPQATPITHVGRYEMGAEIASGGMATVYLARMSGAAGFEKLVALKRVHPHLAKEDAFVDMFLDEARIASRIQHPNVCQVFDFGEADGEYFIAMEFLVGETLAKVQRSIAGSGFLHDPRRPFVAVRLIADACEGLHAAHELRGKGGELLDVVHRDVSPQNLFVGYDGNVKVVDFGIASASDRLHQTSSGTVKGKFAYMAPEQARGKRVDRRADVFALGVVLWELLAFQRLFRRDTPAETLVALMGEDIKPPSNVSPLSPPELDDIVLKALERDPDKRYQTARELGRDLVRAAGRIGDSVDRVEVAEWMEALFPEGRRRHSILLESARWGEAAERTERSDPGPVSEVISRSSWSGVRPEELLADAGDVVEIEPPPMPAAMPVAAPASLTPHAVPLPPPKRSGALKWVGLGALACVVSTLTVVVLTQLLEPSEVPETAQVAQAGPQTAAVSDPPVDPQPDQATAQPTPQQPTPSSPRHCRTCSSPSSRPRSRPAEAPRRRTARARRSRTRRRAAAATAPSGRGDRPRRRRAPRAAARSSSPRPAAGPTSTTATAASSARRRSRPRSRPGGIGCRCDRSGSRPPATSRSRSSRGARSASASRSEGAARASEGLG
ncbi:MAG: serine/threonine protein kinase [Sandaracinaceae bacterium]|nr:serine/threonine protein kinase [Sandaracinaceae bacterium]